MLKSANVSRSYLKKQSGQLILSHGVVNTVDSGVHDVELCGCCRHKWMRGCCCWQAIVCRWWDVHQYNQLVHLSTTHWLRTRLQA